MATEIAEIPAALEWLLSEGANSIRAAADSARTLSPAVITTVVRGSSDQAASYFKYAAPLALIVSFYSTIERFAREVGINPDQPRHLRKVTQTV